MPRLTQLQRDFVYHYVASDDPQTRHNGMRAYQAAGGQCTTYGAVKAAASRMLAKAHVRHAIEVAHAQADAELLIRLRDWKAAAIEAQPILLNLARGYMPDGRRMLTVADAAIGHLALGAVKEIMDRGFPKSLYVKIDARQALAKILGIPVERLPDRWDDVQEDC